MTPTPVLCKGAQFYRQHRTLHSPWRPSIYSLSLREGGRAFQYEDSSLLGKETESIKKWGSRQETYMAGRTFFFFKYMYIVLTINLKTDAVY